MIALLLCLVLAAMLLGAVARLAWRWAVDEAARRWIESPAWCEPRAAKPWYVVNYERYYARRMP